MQPKWHKPRTALCASLAFGSWATCGALATGPMSLVPFGLICAAVGVLIYGADCGMQRRMNGEIRPPVVLRTDLRWAGWTGGLGTVLGLAAPLHAS